MIIINIYIILNIIFYNDNITMKSTLHPVIYAIQ